nr:hypothetical protein N8D75_17865 [Curtobacterium flaccumfaciens]
MPSDQVDSIAAESSLVFFRPIEDVSKQNPPGLPGTNSTELLPESICPMSPVISDRSVCPSRLYSVWNSAAVAVPVRCSISCDGLSNARTRSEVTATSFGPVCSRMVSTIASIAVSS